MFMAQEVPIKKITDTSDCFRRLNHDVKDAENDISLAVCAYLNKLENKTGFLVKKVIIDIRDCDECDEDSVKEDREVSIRVLLDTDHFSKE